MIDKSNYGVSKQREIREQNISFRSVEGLLNSFVKQTDKTVEEKTRFKKLEKMYFVLILNIHCL